MAWGYRTMKLEHAGAKRGRSFWGSKKEAKEASKRGRRRQDKKVINE